MIPFLFVTGIVFLLMGMACIIDPVAALTPRLGIHLDGINALSQVRGSSGGVTAAMGVFMVYAATQPRLHAPALWLIVVVLGGLEAGRIVSLVSDGVPDISLWFSMAIEWLGLLQGVYFLRERLRIEAEARGE